jgi:hypothetical protein
LMAGESARDVAQRQRAKAERLARSAALWERGAEGEEAVAAALAQLPSETWTVFHDVKWPGRRYANVDHIVVGPPGVFVIDAKNWSGQVAVKGAVLRQNGFSRERDVAGAAEAGLAVAGLVPLLKPNLVHPVLCFVSDEELSGWVRDVMVCTTSNVARMLAARPAVLPGDEQAQLCLDLDLGLRDAASSASTPAAARATRVRRSTSARPAKKATASRSRKRRSSWSGLAPAVIGLGMAAVLMLRPDVVTDLADEMSGLFVENISDTSKPEPKKQHPRKPGDRKEGVTQGG